METNWKKFEKQRCVIKSKSNHFTYFIFLDEVGAEFLTGYDYRSSPHIFHINEILHISIMTPKEEKIFFKKRNGGF